MVSPRGKNPHNFTSFESPQLPASILPNRRALTHGPGVSIYCDRQRPKDWPEHEVTATKILIALEPARCCVTWLGATGQEHSRVIGQGDLVILAPGIVEVTGFAPDGSIQLRDGRTIPTLFREFSHGYATTSHAAQGKTVDHGILIMAEDGIAAGNLKQAYVSNSRFRLSQTIYTTDRREARAAMMSSGDRTLARELGESPTPPAVRTPALRLTVRSGALGPGGGK